MRNEITGTQAPAPDAARESRPADTKRRRFLVTLGATGAGAAVAAAALPAVAAPQPSAAPSSDEDAAYRATRHVRDYYRTAKI